MEGLLTPDLVIRELQRIQAESSKAPQAIYDAFVAVVEAERLLKHKWNTTYLATQGTAADRKAIADLACEELEDAHGLARANLERVRAKARQLSEAGGLTQTIGRQVELAMR